MARISEHGLEDVERLLEQLSHVPEAVQDNMLAACARIITPAQQAKGRAYGVHRTGLTASSIRADRVKSGKRGRHIDVFAHGKNKQGRPNAEVAFVNNFGARGNPPRPFVDDANEEASNKAFVAEVEVYDNWLKSLE